MKYCTKCGQELTDDAAVCTTCGASQQAPEKKKKKEKKPANVSYSFWLANLVNCVFYFLAICAFAFMMIALVFPYIYVYTGGYGYGYSYAYAHFYPTFVWSLVAFIISCVTLSFSFVSILTNSICAILRKVQSNYVFGSFIQFFLSSALFTITLLMMINSW